MSILSVLEAVPNRIQLLGRTIAAEGPMSRADLQGFVQQPDPSQFNNIVREAVRLGFLSEDKTLGLSLAVPKKVANDVEEFRLFCFERLITRSPDHNDENSSFPRAAAWFLSRPTWPQLRWGGEVRQYINEELQGDDFFDLTNESRAQMFAYWAQFLGLMERTFFDGVTYCSADPARAIESIARSILRPGSSFAIRDFLSELSSKAPVLEGGVFRKEAEGRSKKRRDDQAISPATSLALLRLELKGTLSFEEASDAEVWTLGVTDDERRRISKVSLKAKK